MTSFIKDQMQREEPLWPDNSLLTACEVAEYLRFTVTTVINLAVSGELPGFKIGKSWRFDSGEVMRKITTAKQQAKTADRTTGRVRKPWERQ